MSLLKEVMTGLIGMFLGDVRLTIAILVLVAISGALIDLSGIDPLVGGGALIFGCPVLLIANLRREKRAIAPMNRSAA
jgi:hypothetical protein